MSSSYNGNAAHITPFATFTITEPADLDPATAASVNNPGPFQILADLAAYASKIPIQPAFATSSLPAAATVNQGVGGGSGTSHYSLLHSLIAGVSNSKNLRFYYRTDDGAWIATQNASAGSGHWTADDTSKPANIFIFGGRLIPSTSASGFGFYTIDAPDVAGWFDCAPGLTGSQCWTGDFAFDQSTGFTLRPPDTAAAGIQIQGPAGSQALVGIGGNGDSTGLQGEGGPTNGIGVLGLGSGSGHGVKGVGSGSGAAGVDGHGGTGSPGVTGTGGAGGPGVLGFGSADYGVQGQGGVGFAGGGFTGGTNGDGVDGQGDGGGTGGTFTGGATGHGVVAVATGASADAVNAHAGARYGFATTANAQWAPLHIDPTPGTSAPANAQDGDIACYGSGGSRHFYGYVNGGWHQLD
jgi:hypothetical protein